MDFVKRYPNVFAYVVCEMAAILFGSQNIINLYAIGLVVNGNGLVEVTIHSRVPL